MGAITASTGASVTDALLGLAGALLVVIVLDSALRSFVLPRSVVQPLTRAVALAVRRVFDVVLRPTRTYEARDRIMALYVPILVVVLPVVWLITVVVGYVLLFRAIETSSWRHAFDFSGSSLMTLGFTKPGTVPGTILALTEAAIGLAVIALLIAFLPAIYGAFSRREVLVAKLAARGGNPVSGVEILVRARKMERFHLLDELYVDWQTWFAEVEESHTSLAFLPLLRSPRAERSWITAAGAVLDSAALYNAVVDVPWSPDAGYCVRAGFTALRSISDVFGIPYDADPAQTDPISIARDEFEEACRALERAEIALKANKEQAWIDFNGWRVNYDAPLLGLAGLVMAPYAPWSSDRSLRYRARLRPGAQARLRRGGV